MVEAGLAKATVAISSYRHTSPGAEAIGLRLSAPVCAFMAVAGPAAAPAPVGSCGPIPSKLRMARGTGVRIARDLGIRGP